MGMQFGFDSKGNYGYGFGIAPNLNFNNISSGYDPSEYHHNDDKYNKKDDKNNDYKKNKCYNKSSENYNKESDNISIDKKINQYNKFLTTGIEVKNWRGHNIFLLIKNIETFYERKDPDDSSVLLTRIKCYNDRMSFDSYESFESVLKKYKDAVASIEELGD